MHQTGMEPAKGRWWKPAHRTEKIWVAVAFGWCMVLFAMMPLWHLKGGQNPTGIRHTVEADDFRERTMEFAETYRVGEENGIPVVEPPPGSDIYLMGRMWAWYPILKLRQNAEYTLHLSSVDVNHGFNLHPVNLNFQVVPGYDYGLRVTPGEAGEFKIVCNEFCGVGHHLMVGKIIVVPEDEEVARLEGETSRGSGAEGENPAAGNRSSSSSSTHPSATAEGGDR